VTVAKLVPLLVFVIAGIFFIKPAALAWPGFPTGKALGDSVLLLLFAFVGVEVALIPSGEVKNPSRTVPRAIYIALVITTVLYVSIQFVAQGTLGADLANNTISPLAEAAGHFLGSFGRMLLLAGATISAFGFVTSDILSSPRILFAFGRDGVLPAWFAHVHPRYRSPDVAIITYAVVAFAFSLSSTFEGLAVMSNIAVLLLYILCCAAAWELMRRNVRADGEPFTVPGAKIFPIAAIIVIVWILAHATAKEFAVAAIVLVIASGLYFLRNLAVRR
jgi:basic amino acid/polyamine antiporter, APA family